MNFDEKENYLYALQLCLYFCICLDNVYYWSRKIWHSHHILYFWKCL